MPAAPPAYRSTARALHWLSAILILAAVPAGWAMLHAGLARPMQNTLFIFHKNVGVLILLLVLVRIAYRTANPPPPLPPRMPVWQADIAHATHVLIYALLIVMAVSGYVRVVAGGFPLEALDALGAPRLVAKDETVAAVAKALHASARVPLVGLILLHVGAALYHGILRRDGVFSRMWPGRG
jgi:cytochrome b561